MRGERLCNWFVGQSNLVCWKGTRKSITLLYRGQVTAAARHQMQRPSDRTVPGWCLFLLLLLPAAVGLQLTVHIATPRNMSYSSLAAAEQHSVAARMERVKAFFRWGGEKGGAGWLAGCSCERDTLSSVCIALCVSMHVIFLATSDVICLLQIAWLP
jgi:hypothetical protein